MEWISVKDRKPCESGEYLVLKRDGRAMVVGYSRRYQRFNTYDDQTGESAQRTAFHDVKYWTPLPAPPADEEDAAPVLEAADIGEAQADTASEAALLVFPLCRDMEWQKDWRRVRCPHCGRACWLRPEAKDLLKEQPELVWACAGCAGKAGV